MKRTMENDNGKPDQGLPAAFRPGGQTVEGTVILSRDDVEWRVVGVDAYDRRVFVKRGQNTCWIECSEPMELYEHGSNEPVEVVCTCTAGSTGFSYEPDLDLWVHADCRKPKRLYLDTLVERLLAGEVV